MTRGGKLAPLLLALACAGCGRPSLEARGAALGTTWRVSVARPPEGLDDARLRKLAAAELARVDARMSTWRDDSELVRFNRARTTAWFPVSAETARVVREALDVSELSGGAFDPTVEPLVALWGFGRAPGGPLPPPPAGLAAARARVGYRRVLVREAPPALRKRRAGVALDLSGIAKGHAVDAIAERLLAAGARDFLVEVGGELRAAGRDGAGAAWRVGVERPDGEGRALERVLELRDEAVATSGDYRNFRVRAGERYGHILDPRRGAPVRSDLGSVTVIAPSAARADALATALFVLGPDAGCALADARGWAVLFLLDAEGAWEPRWTRAFADRMGRTDRTDRAPVREGRAGESAEGAPQDRGPGARGGAACSSPPPSH